MNPDLLWEMMKLDGIAGHVLDPVAVVVLDRAHPELGPVAELGDLEGAGRAVVVVDVVEVPELADGDQAEDGGELAVVVQALPEGIVDAVHPRELGHLPKL